MRSLDRVTWVWADFTRVGCDRCREVRTLISPSDAFVLSAAVRIGRTVGTWMVLTEVAKEIVGHQLAARQQFWQEHLFCRPPRRPLGKEVCAW